MEIKITVDEAIERVKERIREDKIWVKQEGRISESHLHKCNNKLALDTMCLNALYLQRHMKSTHRFSYVPPQTEVWGSEED